MTDYGSGDGDNGVWRWWWWVMIMIIIMQDDNGGW